MHLPLLPGVYIMKNEKGEIIYIGKAKLLKNRVSQYFGSQNRHNTKVRRMVDNVYDFDHILTASEYEALVLECSLIKQNKPKYNILLKDDKGYKYIKITNEPWRRLQNAKQRADDGATYIGPYISGFVVKESLDAALKIFQLPQCGKTFPVKTKTRPCLNYHMNQCKAPCAGKMKKAEYDAAVDDAIEFLKGGTKEYIKVLEARMEMYSENLEFEKAAEVRDRINAIKRLTEKQQVIFSGTDTKDIFALARNDEEICFNVLRFVDGRLTGSINYFTELDETLENTRSEMIKRFYSSHDNIPKMVILDGESDDMELLAQWLTDLRGTKVDVFVPQKGRQMDIVSMSKNNAYEALAQKKSKSKADSAVIELGELLGLSKAPEYIESYDISHTAGADTVGGMVVFKNGAPYKSGYRKFIVNDVVGGDDLGAMREVLTRRFSHQNDDEFPRLPDLILMDGGENQVNVALEVLKSYGLNIPVFGMVKDQKHKTRAITVDGGEITISATRKVFTLVSAIQEEVHRFAISYHHAKHQKNAKQSELTSIEGIGQKKAEILWREFKTLDRIKRADIDTLASVKGISVKDAVNIKNHFSK
ncbi:MAG: excinuclease ABC subunit UvrC [Oscillospiraceae bacterium]|nr:excinuclease ABC subunit UvrC [Candidatus Limimonas egerieequi]